MKYDLVDMVQQNHNCCIVDEVDSILIDESRTPYNSGKQRQNNSLASNDSLNIYKKMITN